MYQFSIVAVTNYYYKFIYFYFFTVEQESFIRRESTRPDVGEGLSKRRVAQKAKLLQV